MDSTVPSMALAGIFSDRSFQRWPSWHLIYEWEDQISESLDLPIIDSREKRLLYDSKVSRLVQKARVGRVLLQWLDSSIVKNARNLYFEMVPSDKFTLSTSAQTIPVIIDFWKTTNLGHFYATYKNCPMVLLSSLEVYNFLKREGCPLRIHHFPMSLPDKYRLDGDSYIEKKYDIVMAGRKSPVFFSYLKEYEQKHPSVEYLYQETIDGELYYFSNKSGVVGKFQSRERYIQLLQSAKVSLYSTPGIDGGEERTGGFNPVTPRWFELLYAGCRVLGRYARNDETEFYQLNTLCPNIESFGQFSKELTTALSCYGLPLKKNNEYLQNHYTSKRIALLKEILGAP
jgi:hypothetical protein